MVVDRTGRLVVYRAWQGTATQDANSALMAAAAYLAQTGIKPTYAASKRGSFTQYYFTLHKDNQPVRLMSGSMYNRSRLAPTSRGQGCQNAFVTILRSHASLLYAFNLSSDWLLVSCCRVYLCQGHLTWRPARCLSPNIS